MAITVENIDEARAEEARLRAEARLAEHLDDEEAATVHASLAKSLAGVKSKFLVISFTSDWLFPSYQAREIVSALRNNNSDVIYMDIESDGGHDAFLLEVAQQTRLIGNFLAHGKGLG